MAGSHPARHRQRVPLNESPSEKEGKFDDFFFLDVAVPSPSMKVPPKRKGNALAKKEAEAVLMPSMKVPPKRKGNFMRPSKQRGFE